MFLDKNDFRIKRKKKVDKLLYLLNFKLLFAKLQKYFSKLLSRYTHFWQFFFISLHAKYDNHSLLSKRRTTDFTEISSRKLIFQVINKQFLSYRVNLSKQAFLLLCFSFSCKVTHELIFFKPFRNHFSPQLNTPNTKENRPNRVSICHMLQKQNMWDKQNGAKRYWHQNETNIGQDFEHQNL